MAARAARTRRATRADASDPRAESLVRAEREFVHALGGLSLGLAGGVLVTHERIAVPRFNFALVDPIDPGRRTAYFERALDHYFQRALRPTFRVRAPVRPDLDATLRHLGFRPRAEPVDLLVSVRRAPSKPPVGLTCRPDPRDSRDLARLWVAEREIPELASALDVLRYHPNPGERLVPVVAEEDGALLASALVYRFADTALVFGVTTVPDARGRGVASALTDWVRRTHAAGSGALYGILSEQRRLTQRLERMGFRRLATFRVYELPAEARLELPGPPAAGPALWRPPRRAGRTPSAP